jgi:Neuraminidase (sialidase)
MGKRYVRKSGNNKTLFDSNLLTWTWVLLTIVVSTILISACSNGEGDSPQTLIVVWNSNEDLDNASADDDDIFFSRSTDGGETWSVVRVLNSYAASDGMFDNDYFPRAMTDGKGVWVTVWETNVDLDNAGTDWDIFFSRSTDDGETWGDPQLLDSNAVSGTGYDEIPAVMTDGNGTWVTVWTSSENFNGAGTDQDIFFSRSTDNGATWSTSQLIDSQAILGAGRERHPAVMTDGKGTWVTVWRSSEDFNGAGNDEDIFFSRSTDNGATWSASQPLNSSNTNSDNYPSVMTDGKGTWVAAWFSNENLGGAGTDYDIFFSRSTDNGATWSASQLLNSNATKDVGDEDWRPALMTDCEGNWIAAWNYYDNSTDIDISFSRSTDGGATWGAQQALNSNAAQDTSDTGGSYPGIDNRPSVLSCGLDIWIAVWQSREDLYDADIDSDIFFSRSTDDGVSWSASQALNSNASTDLGDDLFGHEE